MKKFWIMSHQDREDLQGVTAYEGIDEFVDRTSIFRDGLPFHGTIPKEVRFYVSAGGICDYLPNAKSWPIVSTRLLKIIQQFSSDFQVFDAPLFNKETKEPISEYKILNVTRRLEAADLEKSKARCFSLLGQPVLHIDVTDFVFHDDLIPQGVHLFRACEAPTLIFISDDIVRAMRGRVDGVSLIPTGCA
jgi:hypothetical protein